jgi:hypothetical protein
LPHSQIPDFASANPKGRESALLQIEEAVKQLKKVFVGSGTISRTIEQMIPHFRIGKGERVLDVVNKFTIPDEHSRRKKSCLFPFS